MSSIIINIDTALTDVPIIEIGKQGENEATQVVFDVSDMIDTFGSGTAYVVVQRRGDAEPYLLDNTQQSSDKVTWTVSNVDTDVYGMGRVQLFWLIDDQVAKSVNYQFYVEEALGNPTDAPVVPGGWISEKIGDLDELTTTAKENLVTAINEVNALAVEMADDIEGLTANVETLQEQMETKANVDGLYEDMTVGNAEQLIASDYVTDKAPYLFRKTGGSTDVGNREYDTLVGASVVWNQLVKNGDFSDGTTEWSSYLADLSASNGVLTATSTSAEYNSVQARQLNMSIKSGRKYLVNADIMTSVSTTGTKIGYSGSGTTIMSKALTANTWTNFVSVFNAASDADRILFYLDNSATHPVGSTISLKNVNLIDLTQFFGSSTIPDYVYSLEQSTSGSGVAWLRQYFPTLFEYHEYDAGTLKSVEGVESHDMVGFNAWDGRYEAGKWINDSATGTIANATGYNVTSYIRIIPNTVYYHSLTGSIRGTYFDADKNAIGACQWNAASTETMPSNAHYVRFTVTDANLSNFIINLSNSGYRNGEYESYWKRSYPLDSTWVGRGLYKLGSDGRPYADGDIYESDGSGEVRYGIVDLGSLTWTRLTTDTEGKYRFSAGGLSDIIKKPASLSENGSVICAKYITISGDKPIQNIQGIAVHTNGNVLVYDESLATADASAFTTAMSGIYLIYELATPTSATYEPFQSPQICDDFGTQEYVTDCLIPVGHETKYPANLRDKVQHLPDLSNLGNGNYIINQTGTQMSLIPITSIIPAVPTTNGTYKLKCTVSGDQATLTWEVDS